MITKFSDWYFTNESKSGVSSGSQNEPAENGLAANAKEINNSLQRACENIKDEYAKCLAVLNVFDPNSLGTMSEVILTKLLSNPEKTGIKSIKSVHTGKSQGLSDLVVTINKKQYDISLKTTLSNKAIGLGSLTDKLQNDDRETLAAVENMKNALSVILNSKHDKMKQKLNGKSIAYISKNSKKFKDNATAFISKIVEKLVGKDDKNPEVFFWVKKNLDDTKFYLTSIDFIGYSFNKEELTKFFMNDCKVYAELPRNSKEGATIQSWGLKYNDNIVVHPDTKKTLNISPKFIELLQSDAELNKKMYKRIVFNHFDILTEDMLNKIKNETDSIRVKIKSGISDNIIKMLLNAYHSLFEKNSHNKSKAASNEKINASR